MDPNTGNPKCQFTNCDCTWALTTQHGGKFCRKHAEVISELRKEICHQDLVSFDPRCRYHCMLVVDELYTCELEVMSRKVQDPIVLKRIDELNNFLDRGILIARRHPSQQLVDTLGHGIKSKEVTQNLQKTYVQVIQQ